MAGVTHFDLPSYLPLLAAGKVRQIFELDSSQLLFVATDKISAYDAILQNAVPEKGSILTQISQFWFQRFQQTLPNLNTHLISPGIPQELRARLRPDLGDQVLADLEARSMVVKRLRMLPVESIVRGYITGSAWSSYQKNGTVCGIALPEGLLESQKFDYPIWTPSTKAEIGQHDENISSQDAARLIGKDLARQVEQISLGVYVTASAYAAQHGIIIADTKFEFGVDESTTPPTVVLADEVLTPDSSRFWDGAKYEVGRGQASFDKQYLRDWLAATSQKGKENVTMPDEIITNTSIRYKQAFEMLTKQTWSSK